MWSVELGHLGLFGVVLPCGLDLVLAPGKLVLGETGEVRFFHSDGQWHLGQVWAPSVLSGVVWLFPSAVRGPPVVGSFRIGVPQVHGCVWVLGMVVGLVELVVWEGESLICGVPRALCFWLVFPAECCCLTHRQTLEWYRLSRSCPGLGQVFRSGLLAPALRCVLPAPN